MAELDLAGKTAVITGASSGFGRETARVLAARGVRVAGGARRAERLETEIALEVDVRDPVSSARFVDEAVAQLGGIDILINSAGLALGRYLFDESTEADEQQVFETNVNGLVRMTRLCLPHIRDGGHIVNLGSIAGRQAYEKAASYVASKFAVRGFTEALRQELDMANCGVSATCVHPGGIRTNIAKDAKMDESMHKATGGKTEEARAKFDKLLNATSAESAARTILGAVEGNKRRVLVGLDAKFLDKLVRVLGSWYQPLITLFAKKGMLG